MSLKLVSRVGALESSLEQIESQIAALKDEYIKLLEQTKKPEKPKRNWKTLTLNGQDQTEIPG